MSKTYDKNSFLKLSDYQDFLESGGDVNAIVNIGGKDTPLLVRAVGNSDKDSCEFLLTRGADMNVRDENDATVLHIASGKGDREIVEWLLSNPSNMSERDFSSFVTATDANGETALHYAVAGAKCEKGWVAFFPYLNICDLLKEARIDPAAENYSHQTACDLIPHHITGDYLVALNARFSNVYGKVPVKLKKAQVNKMWEEGLKDRPDLLALKGKRGIEPKEKIHFSDKTEESDKAVVSPLVKALEVEVPALKVSEAAVAAAPPPRTLTKEKSGGFPWCCK
ncbi:MAG: ankyrin repeat domain-containing protein [Rickettsiaceae bacterium]|nr:ankyrin repeat domain-containing protein [Rickettsiaceae bacterium]